LVGAQRSSSRRAGFGWAVVAQGFSSATNLALTVLAGRLLGPAGLGMVAIGFAAYQLVLGLQRALVTLPLIAHSAPLIGRDRQVFVGSGATLITASGIAAALVCGGAGFVVGGDLGRGLLLFAPWMIVGLTQDYWKAVLFQDQKGSIGAASECGRILLMVLALPIVLAWQKDYVIVGAWGVAATGALVIAIWGKRVQLCEVHQSVAVWRREGWGLGRWLGSREVGYQFLSYATVLTLVGLLGSGDFGGLRSAEALFSPFSLIAAAFVPPALPALSRALAISRTEAHRLAWRIGGATTSFGVAYFLLMIAIGPWLLTHLFGGSFARYDDLIWPMALSQLLSAASFPIGVLFAADKRGFESFASGIALALATLALATAFAAIYGVLGAAWGMAAGSAVGAGALIALSAHVERSLGRRTTEDFGSPRLRRDDLSDR
jgi:O-antigen/teichoic acid export membrane protein